MDALYGNFVGVALRGHPFLKQPNPPFARPITAFEKLSPGGHTLQADYHAIPEIWS